MTINLPYIRRKIRLGVQAYEAGELISARLHFQAALREDAENIPALLWLAFLADTFEKQTFYFNRILELDTDNERAVSGLTWAKQKNKNIQQQEAIHSALNRLANDNRQLPTSAEDVFILSQKLKQETDSHELKVKAKKGTIAQRARRRIRPSAWLLLFGLFAGITMLLATQWLRPPVSAAAISSKQKLETQQHASTYLSDTLPPLPVFTDNAPKTALETSADAPAAPSGSGLISLLDQPEMPPSISRPLAHRVENTQEKWIEVELSTQTVRAWEGTHLSMEFRASTGLSNTPTRVGRFRIYQKYKTTLMSGADYYLPDVPYTMYYDGGYAIHGVYWHNNFGERMSHGCINLSMEDAKKLFDWAGPVLSAEKESANATFNNPGTLVIIHQ